MHTRMHEKKKVKIRGGRKRWKHRKGGEEKIREEQKTTDKFGRMATVQAEERSGKSKGQGGLLQKNQRTQFWNSGGEGISKSHRKAVRRLKTEKVTTGTGSTAVPNSKVISLECHVGTRKERMVQPPFLSDLPCCLPSCLSHAPQVLRQEGCEREFRHLLAGNDNDAWRL